MSSSGRLIVVTVLVFSFSAAHSLAQVTGSVAGTVRDSSGAVLPGASVTVRGAALQRDSVSTTTTSEGTYRIPVVPPGMYEVRIELSGFAPQTRRNIEVVLNQQTTQSNRTGCFAIRQMMDNFRGAPFAGNEIGSQRLWRKVFESARNFRVAVFVTSN